MDDRVIDGLPIWDSQFLNSATDMTAIKTEAIWALMSYKSTKGSLTLSLFLSLVKIAGLTKGIGLFLDRTFGNRVGF